MFNKLFITNNFDALVLSYQNSEIAQDKTAQAIFGGFAFKGKIPVSTKHFNLNQVTVIIVRSMFSAKLIFILTFVFLNFTSPNFSENSELHSKTSQQNTDTPSVQTNNNKHTETNIIKSRPLETALFLLLQVIVLKLNVL